MTSIHRYLDEAFAGTELTPEIQDLKEELRGNLAARSAELEAAGTDAATAAQTAIRELGSISELLASLDSAPDSATSAAELNRVRPNPMFVVRAVIFSLLIAASAALTALVAVHALDVPWWVGPIVLAIAVGALTDDSLRQETSQHYPMPNGRSVGFGLTALVCALGVGLTAAFFGIGEVGILIAGLVLFVASIVAFTWFGVTQTNRLKPWALEQQRRYVAEDRFTKDPAAAARFGLYTVVIWTLGIAAFIALTLTVGFAWSWIAIVAAVCVFFLVLARMLFTAKES